MNRAARRHRTELVIARRAFVHRRYRQDVPDTHRYHKDDPMGHCGNRCSVCMAQIGWKLLCKKRERVEGHRQEREAA